MTTTDKSNSIKTTIARLGPQATPRRIVQTFTDLGINVSETHASRIKFQMLRNEDTAARHRANPPAKEKTAAEEDTGAAGVAGRLLKQNFCFP